MKARGKANRRRGNRSITRRLYGPYVIESWLRNSHKRVRRVYLDSGGSTRIESLACLAGQHGVPVVRVAREKLSDLAGCPDHQGAVAEASDFPYVGLDELCVAPAGVLLIVDQLQDPHNLGAVLRTAGAVGAHGVVIPRDNAVSVTPAVESTSAGAASLVRVARVTNVSRAVAEVQQAGYWTMALAGGGEQDLFAAELPERVAFALGGERGLRPLVAARCDVRVRIPMASGVESLNASVAAAVAMYEYTRRYAKTTP